MVDKTGYPDLPSQLTVGRVLTVDVVTPEKTVYSDSRVASVYAPASLGRIGILPGHMPLVSTLEKGELDISEKDGRRLGLLIAPGFIQVLADRVIILVEEAREAGA